MEFRLNTKLADGYRSSSQVIRVITEYWVEKNGYCPNCGNEQLQKFTNNLPVADFYCADCDEQYELKSKKAKLSLIINDGAYDTMIARITGNHNPNFFFLTYSKEFVVNNFLLIPKHFFVPNMIIKRPPLKSTAKRAGWVGCNIDLRKIPDSGKVFLVKNQIQIAPTLVQKQFQKTAFLKHQTLTHKGWTLDIMQCIDCLPETFQLAQVYTFAEKLKESHPDNNNIHAKIRQQLQILRDKGFIEFMGNGHYRKID